MHLNEYQFQAMGTRLPRADELYGQLGLAGECGELLGYFAKCNRDNVSPNPDHVCKELGDILWFIAAIAEDWDFQLEEVAKRNLVKLASRKERNVLGGSGDDR